MNALKTILWSIFVPGNLATIVPFLIISSFSGYYVELSYFRYLGLIPILSGVLLYAWCAWNFTFTGDGTPAPFDAPKKIVATGAYQFVRNPMYVALIAVILGEAIFFETYALLVYDLILFLIFHSWILIYEEPVLRKKFGASYREYCTHISRWLPLKIK